MKLFRCDLCTEEVDEGSLLTVALQWQVKGFDHVCPECNRLLDDARLAIHKPLHAVEKKLFKGFIARQLERRKQEKGK